MRPSLVAPLTFARLAAAPLAFAVVLVVLLGGSSVACSGSETQDVFTAPGAATSGNTGASSGTAVGGGSTDASRPEGSSSACTSEVEPNDSRDDANTLAPERCGLIQASSESDFLTFELDNKSKTMELKFEGEVTLKVTVDGDSVTLGDGKFPGVPFVKDKRYVVEVKAIGNGGNVPWRVELVQQQ
jgi:hypothetical protein